MKNILSTIEDKINYITINRPHQLNALNSETINELNLAIRRAEDDKEIRCIIITGSNDKAFVAGADIKEFINFNPAEGEELARKGQDLLFDLLSNCLTPTIAAINGFALGGGLELAMACHIRLSSRSAKMGLPEVTLGVIPGYGGTQRLASLIGKGRAIEMIVTGSMITAEQAKQWGLVNEVYDSEELLEKCKQIAEKIKRNSPLAISKAIKSINAGFIDGINGFEVEKKEFGACFGTKDFKEGTSAFIEKRKAKF